MGATSFTTPQFFRVSYPIKDDAQRQLVREVSRSYTATLLRSEGSTLPLSFGASRQPKYVSLSTLLLIKSQIISLFSFARRSFHLVIFISLQRIISRVLSLLVLLSSNLVNQLSVAFTKLSLLYVRLVTLFSTRLLFISSRDIVFITRAYHLSLLVFKYQLARLFIHVMSSLVFFLSLFYFCQSYLQLYLSQIIFLIIVFQFAPTLLLHLLSSPPESTLVFAIFMSSATDCDLDL